MLELGGVDPIRGRKEGKLDEGELPPIPDTGVTPDITMLMRQCSATDICTEMNILRDLTIFSSI